MLEGEIDTPKPRFWSRRPVFDTIDLVLLVPIAAFGFLASSTTDPFYKPLWLTLSAVCVILSGFCKWRGKRLDDAEKNAKSTAEKDEKDNNARIAKEESERRDAEINDLRAKYAAQARAMVRETLAHMRDHFFDKEKGDEKYKHRVTLFVCDVVAGCSGKKKCLAIYARDGVYPESTTTWPVDDEHPTGCRGVAAQIWYHGVTRFIDGKFPWPDGDDTAAQVAYAEDLEISLEEARSLRVKSQFFAGALVEVKGRKWGVLLVDSMKHFHMPKEGGQRALQWKRLERYATLIGKLLTEAE